MDDAEKIIHALERRGDLLSTYSDLLIDLIQPKNLEAESSRHRTMGLVQARVGVDRRRGNRSIPKIDEVEIVRKYVLFLVEFGIVDVDFYIRDLLIDREISKLSDKAEKLFLVNLSRSILGSFFKNFNYNNDVAQPTAPIELKKAPRPSKSKEKVSDTFASATDVKAIGRILSTARETAGMTKSAVAKEMGTTHQAIMKLENGEQNPTLKTLNRIAEALGYAVEIKFTKCDPS